MADPNNDRPLAEDDLTRCHRHPDRPAVCWGEMATDPTPRRAVGLCAGCSRGVEVLEGVRAGVALIPEVPHACPDRAEGEERVALLVGLLRSDPNAAVSAVEAARIMRPWHGAWHGDRRSMDRWALFDDGMYATCVEHGSAVLWVVADVDGTLADGEAATMDAARAAVDAVLVAEGWLLADEPT